MSYKSWPASGLKTQGIFKIVGLRYTNDVESHIGRCKLTVPAVEYARHMASSDIQQLEATLPGEHYLDSEHFARERESIFHSEWFCAGRVEGLDGKGDYRLVNILGE
ncbi:MAG: hypothetical protein ACR2QI_05660, partial [Woeseiaceae bacterium]